jgi:hypothetical protein
MKDNQVLYPMTFDYIRNWGEWEAIRELVSNAQDASPDNWSMTLEGNDLIIRDNGAGIQLHQLLLGVSEKSNDSAIGQFGEGMKLAIMVLLRLGYNSIVYSNDLILTASRGEKFGREVLVITHDKNTNPIHGTCVIIQDWKGDDYSNRFVFSQDDDMVFKVTSEGMLLAGGSPLFSKGVYVCELDDYEFGYNINDLSMNRDRSAVSSDEIFRAAGKIWSLIDSVYSWKQFFKAANKNKNEKYLRLASAWSLSDSVKNAITMAFLSVFGDKAVVKTDESLSREAKHRGAEIIDITSFGYSLQCTLVEILKTDRQFLNEQGALRPRVCKKLNANQRKTINSLKKMAAKVGVDYNVVAADIPESIGANGLCDHGGQTIWINHLILDDVVSSGSTMIHELAHAKYFTSDMTESHCKAMCDIGMELYSK